MKVARPDEREHRACGRDEGKEIVVNERASRLDTGVMLHLYAIVDDFGGRF